MNQATPAAAEHRDGDTAQGKCRSCKQVTTLRFRVKKSVLGLKKTSHWVCTRCGNTQDDLNA